MVIDLTASLKLVEADSQPNLDIITIVVSFTDLLGHHHKQEFTIYCEMQSVGHQNIQLLQEKIK